jgi:hypothetical protein
MHSELFDKGVAGDSASLWETTCRDHFEVDEPFSGVFPEVVGDDELGMMLMGMRTYSGE